MTDPVESPRPLYIVGAGGHGREVLDVVEAAGERRRFGGFVDDGTPTVEALERLTRRAAEVVGDVGWLSECGHSDHVIAIGSSNVRRAIDARLAGSTSRAVPLVDPSAVIGSDNHLAGGVIVGARSVVTTNVRLGRHTHLNVGCSVQHDSVIGDYVTLSPGVFVNGDVQIEDDVFLGTGAIVTRGCRVGAGAVIGAGAVVLRDVSPGARLFGLPARPG